jgi:putative molybdopterin biosynthesis protein
MRTLNQLHEIRTRRGIGVAGLARQTGVSRQTIYAMEAGDYVPNTSVALQLARVLEVSVESLFTLEADAPESAPSVPVEFLGPRIQQGQPVQLCRVGKRTLGISAAPQTLGLPLADGVALSASSAQAFEDQPAYDKRLLVAGCDPAISVLAQFLLRSEGVELIAAPCSSRTALEWLKEGKVHVAGSHLRDDRTGEYNLPVIKRLFPQGGVRVVTFAIWDQGLVIMRGNPKGIRAAADLGRKGVTIVNREQGAGSRQLLDKELAASGISNRQISGYHTIANGHLPAAFRVSCGDADCCIATRSAAQAFGLDFIPLATERYDLVFPRRYEDFPAIQSLLDVLHRSALRRRLELLAGYDTSHTGNLVPG